MSNIKTILFQLNHPAHYHLFRNAIKILRANGYDIQISIKDKDILKDLLVGENYYIIAETYRNNTICSIIASVLKRDYRFYKLVYRLKPDLMIGTSPEIGHVRKFCSTPAIFFGEDDVTISKTLYLGALSCYPFFDSIVSPTGCNNGRWNKKTIFYDGFQKLAYLHPNQFIPDRTKVNVSESERFFLLRFAKLAAYHDINATGIDNEIAERLIKYLELYGKVIISSERTLPKELEKYCFTGDLNDIHHYLYYADIYIGDSQSMAVEASMLGTPSIRFNNFVGKISVLEELEYKYNLTYGIKVTEPDLLFKKVEELLSMQDLKKKFAIKRRKMLADKIDVTAFMVWFIENYPKSVEIMKTNPDYQYNFQ